MISRIFAYFKPRVRQPRLQPVSPTDLTRLICGPLPVSGSSGEFGQALIFIHNSMVGLIEELMWLDTQSVARVARYGPYLGRSFQELAATALLARLDPTRVLLIRKIQAQPDYSLDVPWKSALRWQGDVIAKKVDEKKMWSGDTEYDKITKALLGDYLDQLVWRPAMKAMLSESQNHTGKTWLANLKNVKPGGFIGRSRAEMKSQYSEFSKGVHHEFVIPQGAKYDRKTVANLIDRTVATISRLSLISHFVEHSQYKLSTGSAFSTFNAVEDLEIIK